MISATIIGGGVAGLVVARALRDRGAAVVVYDKGGAPGPHACSWWAGGMLAPFCELESAEEEVVRLGSEAADWWEAKTGCVKHEGSLVVSAARDQADLKRFSRRTRGFRDLCLSEIDALEPDLDGRFSKGLLFESEAHLNPRAALAALRSGLAADDVEFVDQEADPDAITGLVIDCRGYAAHPDLTDLRGVKGEMVVLRCADVQFSRPIRLLHPRIPLYVVPRGDGVFMLGATMIESSAAEHVTARSLLELLSAAYALNPSFGEAEVLEIGVDTRPAFPDNLPRIRQDGDVVRVNGLYRHGFLLAPAVGRMVAEMVFDGVTPEVMDAVAA